MSDNENDDDVGSDNGETNENNALHIAAVEGNVAEVQEQVRNFDINAKGKEMGTALYWASRAGKTEVVRLLLTLNANVNIPDVSTSTVIPLHRICFFSSLILALLIQ